MDDSRARGLRRLEQRLVLQEIERAGNKGIWTRDIKTHTNIPQVSLSRKKHVDDCLLTTPVLDSKW